MTADTITCRHLQSGFVIYNWPLSDWNLHDDAYKADWEVEFYDDGSLVNPAEAPEAPVEAPAPPELPSDAEPAADPQAPAQDA